MVYLENALKEVRPLLPQPVTESEKTLPHEIAYANYVDFIARERLDVTQIQKVLKRYNLEVNVDITEYTILERETNYYLASGLEQRRILCTRIQKAAEALQSDDYYAERR